jgi:hypothetical protein
MEALLSRLASEDVAAMVFFALAFLAGLIVWLTWQWRLHRRTEIEAALTQEMLNRGMSAEEIVRVLRARSGSRAGADQLDAVVPGAGSRPGRQAGNSASSA